MFCRSWSKWPFDLASLGGRYFLTARCVRPGNESRNPCLMANCKVDGAGLKRAAWWNAQRSEVGVSCLMMPFINLTVGSVVLVFSTHVCCGWRFGTNSVE